jgi:hypothetical protein
MTRRARAYLTLAVTAVALTGCAQSSNTTSTSTGAPGAGPPSSSTTATSTSGSGTTGPGTTGTPSGSHALGVSPAVGSPQSTMHFSFTSPQGSGPQGGTLISAALSVVGPHGSACVGIHQQALPSEPAGQSVGVAVGPTQLGGSWCPGTYTARVEVLARPKCGEGMMCPQFIRVVAVLGPTTFRISG